MVIITINGKKSEREFPNMAHALAFAYQNGECYAAETIEFAYVAVREIGQKPEEKASGAGVDSANQAGSSSGTGGKGGKPLEGMTHKELIAYAKELNINVGFFPKDADLIAAIRAKQKATAIDEPGATEPPQNDNAAAGPDAAEPPKDGDGSADSTAEASKEAGVDNPNQTV